MRSALLATCDACDSVVSTITGDQCPQRRQDYGAILLLGLAILIALMAVPVIIVCGLVMLACTAFATHTLTSCVAAGSILAVITVMYAAGKLRRYVYERFEKGE